MSPLRALWLVIVLVIGVIAVDAASGGLRSVNWWPVLLLAALGFAAVVFLRRREGPGSNADPERVKALETVVV